MRGELTKDDLLEAMFGIAAEIGLPDAFMLAASRGFQRRRIHWRML